MASKNAKTCATAQQQRPYPLVKTKATGTSTPPHGSTSPEAGPQVINMEALKLELLASLKQDIAEIF